MARRRDGFERRYEKAKARGEVVSRAELRSREDFEKKKKVGQIPLADALVDCPKMIGVDE